MENVCEKLWTMCGVVKWTTYDWIGLICQGFNDFHISRQKQKDTKKQQPWKAFSSLTIWCKLSSLLLYQCYVSDLEGSTYQATQSDNDVYLTVNCVTLLIDLQLSDCWLVVLIFKAAYQVTLAFGGIYWYVLDVHFKFLFEISRMLMILNPQQSITMITWM